jgi:hypothetical protein
MKTQISRPVSDGFEQVLEAIGAMARLFTERFMPWGCEDQGGFHTESEIRIPNADAIDSVCALTDDTIQTRVETLEALTTNLVSKPAGKTMPMTPRENPIEAAGIWTAEAADAAMKRAGAALEMAVEKLGVQASEKNEQCQLFFPLGSSPTLRH